MRGKILSPNTIFKKGMVSWRKGKGKWGNKKPTCYDCGAKTTYTATRCKSCSRKGKKSWNWKGGRATTGTGYVYILNKSHPNANKAGYVFEHRLVIEKKIGRYLKKFEQVHHLNGIKNDNRLENLEVLNGHTHFLITKMQIRIRQLEKENKEIAEELKKEGIIQALKNK